MERKRKTKEPEFNPLLQATYLEIVDNQLRENDPPEARQTYERLIAEGESDRSAKLLIGSVIAYETYKVLATQTEFDLKRYVRHLNMLPDQSWIDD